MGAEEAAVVAGVVAAAAAVAEVALEMFVAAETVEVEKAVALDPGLQQQKGSATDSSSEPGAAVVREAGCSERRFGGKPETRHVALPCAEPWPVAASEVLREPEGPEDAASAAVAAVGRVAVPEQLVQLASVASVGSGSCAEGADLPFVLAGRRDLPASGRIAGGSCQDGHSCPFPYPCRSSAVAVVPVVAAVAELAALPSSVADEPCVAAVASSIGDCWPL